MHDTRKIQSCLNCGEVREIAAHGLCFKCYRREDRAKDREFAGADRHNPGLRKEHKKIFRGFATVMGGLSDLGLSRGDVLAIRRVMEPYLAPIANFLALTPEDAESERFVNGEQKSGDLFTVHTKVRSDAKKGEPE
jgi:hypothetical protein